MRRLRGLLAISILAGVLVGVPVLLVRGLGGPWPSSAPSMRAAQDAWRSGDIDASTIIAVLATITWLAWARIALAVVIDVLARARGLGVPHIAVLGSSQRLARSLVSSALLVLPSVRPVAASSEMPHLLEPAPVFRFVDGVAQTATPTPNTEPIANREAAPVGDSSAQPTWVVRRHDSWWSIAEHTLGDGARWREIVAVNTGRSVAPGVIFDGTADRLLPGWTLVLPETSASETSASETSAPETTADEPPRSIAADHHDDASVWPAVCIDVAAEPAVPPTAVPAPTGPVDPPRDPPTTDVASARTPVDPAGPAWTAADRPVAAPVGVGGAVVLSAGVVGAVHLRRQRQLRRSTVRSRLHRPNERAIRTELTLRALDRHELLARIDLAMRSAASGLVRTDGRPLGALVGRDGRVDVLLSGWAHDAPAPWVAAATADRWTLPPAVTLDELAESARHTAIPCPALCQIGEVDDDLLMIDLESLGLLSIDGPPAAAAAIVRGIAASLAVSALAETAHLVVTGLEPAATLGHPQAHHTVDLDAALDLAATALGSTIGATADGISTFDLRTRHTSGDAWEPAIVLSAGQPLDPGLGADLAEMCSQPRRGLAVVVDRPVPGAPWSLRCDDDRWTLHPLQLDLRPVGISADDAAAIGELLDEAGAALFDDPAGGIAAPTPGVAAFVERPRALMVRLLGDVDVVDGDGRVATFERSKAIELVAWLTQHRANATRMRARTALWDHNVRDATFANVVSDARRALARAVPPPHGAEWIGRTLTEALPLDDRVVTDAELLADRLAHARRCTPHEAIDVLRPGVELIRGAPLGPAAYPWADAEGITSSLVLLATAAAAELAAMCLRVGDIEGVFWATSRGLGVLPGHEELIALRMRAHARAGDHASVRAEWAAYERVLTSDPWSDGSPAPKLVALRRELLATTFA